MISGKPLADVIEADADKSKVKRFARDSMGNLILDPTTHRHKTEWIDCAIKIVAGPNYPKSAADCHLSADIHRGCVYDEDVTDAARIKLEAEVLDMMAEQAHGAAAGSKRNEAKFITLADGTRKEVFFEPYAAEPNGDYISQITPLPAGSYGSGYTDMMDKVKDEIAKAMSLVSSAPVDILEHRTDKTDITDIGRPDWLPVMEIEEVACRSLLRLVKWTPPDGEHKIEAPHKESFLKRYPLYLSAIGFTPTVSMALDFSQVMSTPVNGAELKVTSSGQLWLDTTNCQDEEQDDREREAVRPLAHFPGSLGFGIEVKGSDIVPGDQLGQYWLSLNETGRT